MSDPKSIKPAARNLEAEAVWGYEKPSDQRMEDIVCEGYIPFLNWEFFRWAYPCIEFGPATEMFLSALHRVIDEKRLYVMLPPHVTDPEVGTKQIGNTMTGQRLEYWKADADEVFLYFKTFWPNSDIRGQTLADHQSLNWPCFCFPMSAEFEDPLNEYPNFDWSDCFMFP